MNNDKYVNLYFDKFIFPVSYKTLEKFILDELNKLSRDTGYDIENLTIEFKENNDNNVIAYFAHAGDKPIGFCFFLNKFADTSSNKVIDTCRHEFAHFVVCVQNSGHQPKDEHGTEWRRVCNSIGARPNAFMSNMPTKHFA